MPRRAKPNGAKGDVPCVCLSRAVPCRAVPSRASPPRSTGTLRAAPLLSQRSGRLRAVPSRAGRGCLRSAPARRAGGGGHFLRRAEPCRAVPGWGGSGHGAGRGPARGRAVGACAAPGRRALGLHAAGGTGARRAPHRLQGKIGGPASPPPDSLCLLPRAPPGGREGGAQGAGGNSSGTSVGLAGGRPPPHPSTPKEGDAGTGGHPCPRYAASISSRWNFGGSWSPSDPAPGPSAKGPRWGTGFVAGEVAAALPFF